MELEARQKKKTTVSDIIFIAVLSFVLSPIGISFLFAFIFGPDVAYSLPNFIVMWFFAAFTFMTTAMAVAGLLENVGLIKVPPGTGTGPLGTLFYIIFAAFLNFALIKELRILVG
jgi:hypothetical protein